eukprot:993772-Amphidinium_carterae.1
MTARWKRGVQGMSACCAAFSEISTRASLEVQRSSPKIYFVWSILHGFLHRGCGLARGGIGCNRSPLSGNKGEFDVSDMWGGSRVRPWPLTRLLLGTKGSADDDTADNVWTLDIRWVLIAWRPQPSCRAV